MATYLTFVNWTAKGIEAVKGAPGRLDAARAAGEAVGVKMTHFYLLMGRHDMLVIWEAESDEAMAKLALTIGRQGNVRTTTMKAFTEAQFREMLAEI